MIIKNEKPPIWDSACMAFNINPSHTLFTYGHTIYNPGAIDPIAEHLFAHEEVHEKQQTENGMTPDVWWGKFLRDPAFRLDQEARAYGAQYAFICKTTKDRNQQYKVLLDLAGVLAGPLYAGCVSRQEATTLIKRYSGMK